MRQWREQYEYQQRQIHEQQKIETNGFVKGLKSSSSTTNQDDAVTQYHLSVTYYNGDKVSRNYVKAVKYFQRTTDQGYTLSQLNLGVMSLKVKV